MNQTSKEVTSSKTCMLMDFKSCLDLFLKKEGLEDDEKTKKVRLLFRKCRHLRTYDLFLNDLMFHLCKTQSFQTVQIFGIVTTSSYTCVALNSMGF